MMAVLLAVWQMAVATSTPITPNPPSLMTILSNYCTVYIVGELTYFCHDKMEHKSEAADIIC
jgi:hypothetical protein